ncbi:ATP-binding protein [Lentzea californiensis]|uniref:ATP-binding protein n=1 Tax=Lentzea californiensis TaxID=438851 RepID=UPI00216551F3|nr:ATP-binding protein [Lentzea californiensis]MCR3752519.1 AAA ATPase domain-containing protein [Lentzea californiensis]
MNETEGFGVHVDGHAYSSVVAGHHNLVIDARNGSVSLQVEKERPQPVRRKFVSMLPRSSKPPFGRDAEAAALAADIAAGGVIQLCGPGGIGKSTLLRHLARTVQSGPDGTVFVSRAHHQAGDLAQEIFEACYDTWGYAPSAADLRGLMAGIRVTVYVDDADLEADQLRRLADLIPDATFVLASRESTLLGDTVVHDLRGLDQDAASLLMSEALGRPLRDTDEAAMAALCQASNGNPLLLVMAAGLARSARPRPGGAELPQPGAVPHLIPSLLAQLDTPDMTVLSLLATLEDAELAPGHIRDLTGESDSDGISERLTDLGLAVRGENGYHCAPGVVAALRNHDTSGLRIELLCQYFTSWASTPATDPARVAHHSRVFERLATLATTAGRPDLAVALGRAASPALARSLRFDAWGRVLGRGWTAARRGGDREAEAYFVREESFRSRVTGRHVIAAALAVHAVTLMNSMTDLGGAAVPPSLPPPPDPGITPETPGDLAQLDDHMSALDNDIADPVVDHFPDVSYPDPSWSDAGFGSGTAGQEPVPDTGCGDGGVSDASAGAPQATASVAPAAAPTVSAAAPAAGVAGTAGTAAAGAGWLGLLLTVVLAIIVTVVVNNSIRPTGVLGNWKDAEGGGLTVKKSGPGSYTMAIGCDGDILLIGNDFQVSGTAPLHDGYACGPVLGRVRISITASADGETGTLVVTAQTRSDVQCYSCGTFGLTR